MTDTPPCVCHLDLFGCPVHPRIPQPRKVGSWWETPIEPPVRFEAGDTVPAMTPEQAVAILAPERPGTLPWTGTWRTEPDGSRVCDFRLTDLNWGEGVSTDATRTDREVGIPVCDDDGRELGEMRMGYANARVLMVMLADIVTDAYEPSTDWVKRKRFDQFDDDQLDDLYDRLEMAEQIIAGYRLRNQPKTWKRQATAIVTQAKEIGELKRAVEETDTERAFQRDLAQKHWAAVRRIREIHHPVECVNVGCAEKQWCIGCDPDGYRGCSESPWPCPTVKALDDTPDPT